MSFSFLPNLNLHLWWGGDQNQEVYYINVCVFRSVYHLLTVRAVGERVTVTSQLGQSGQRGHSSLTVAIFRHVSNFANIGLMCNSFGLLKFPH